MQRLSSHHLPVAAILLQLATIRLEVATILLLMILLLAVILLEVLAMILLEVLAVILLLILVLAVILLVIVLLIVPAVRAERRAAQGSDMSGHSWAAALSSALVEAAHGCLVSSHSGLRSCFLVVYAANYKARSGYRVMADRVPPECCTG